MIRHNPFCCLSSRTGCLILGWIDVALAVLLITESCFLFYVGYEPVVECSWNGDNINTFRCTDRPQNVYAESYEYEDIWGDRQKTSFRTTTLSEIGFLMLLASTCLFLLPAWSLIYGAYTERFVFLTPYVVSEIVKGVAIFAVMTGAFGSLPFLCTTALSFWFVVELYKTISACYHIIWILSHQKEDSHTEYMLDGEGRKVLPS